MEKLHLLTVTVLITLAFMHNVEGFRWPTMDWLTEVFGGDEETEALRQERLERAKRQAGGDECSDVFKSCTST